MDNIDYAVELASHHVGAALPAWMYLPESERREYDRPPQHLAIVKRMEERECEEHWEWKDI